MHATLPLLRETDFRPIGIGDLKPSKSTLGCRRNQSCLHCHDVAAGPNRTEEMSLFVARHRVATLDITGLAPELHPRFRDLVRRATRFRVHIVDRCNLAVVEEPRQGSLAEVLMRALRSWRRFPCYIGANVGDALDDQPIVVADHCYGCSAGQSSSCSGAFTT